MSRFEKPWAHTVNKMTKNPDNLKVISFGRIAANINYQSIRKGLEDARLKDGFRFIFTNKYLD